MPIGFFRRRRIIDPKHLAQFVGRYKYLDRIIDVALLGGALTLTIPGQTPLRLAPEIDGSFTLGDQRSVGVKFVTGPGRVTGMQLLQPNGVFDLPRVMP